MSNFIFLNKKPMPDVNCLTILFFRCINLPKSKLTFPVEMPCSSACFDISINFSEEFNKALDGIQPIFKHVPPSVFSFSTQATFIPSCAPLIAATYPPGPAPITIKS